jgi:hypothetical protein
MFYTDPMELHAKAFANLWTSGQEVPTEYLSGALAALPPATSG